MSVRVCVHFKIGCKNTAKHLMPVLTHCPLIGASLDTCKTLARKMWRFVSEIRLTYSPVYWHFLGIDRLNIPLITSYRKQTFVSLFSMPLISIQIFSLLFFEANRTFFFIFLHFCSFFNYLSFLLSIELELESNENDSQKVWYLLWECHV